MAFRPDDQAPPDRQQPSAEIEVLIVDDSLVARSVLERIVETSPATRVVGSVASVSDAISHFSRQRADIILLDIEMPDCSGIEGLPELLAVSDGARVIVVSAQAEDHGPAAVAALAAGACDALAKPGRRGYAGNFAATLVDRIVQVSRRRTDAARSAATIEESDGARRCSTLDLARPCVIAIGGSTGAISALSEFLTTLAKPLACPVLVTQHLPAQFIPYFAEQLARSTGLSVTMAVDGAVAHVGQIYIAPGHRHLGCRIRNGQPHLFLFEGDYPVRYTPAVDAMFGSVADSFGDSALAIILSGMGRDGANGAAQIMRAGGQVLAQDSATSVVWGMPGAAVRAGIVEGVGNPASLAACVNRAFSA